MSPKHLRLVIAASLISLMTAAIFIFVVRRTKVFSSPKIGVKEPAVDLGVLPEAIKSSQANFLITNLGKSKLRIKGMRLTCGCLEAHLDKAVLAANESTNLAVRVLNIPHPGRHTYHAFVTTNDPQNRITRLTVTWVTEMVWVVRPSRLEFDDVKDGAVYNMELEVLGPTGDDRFKIVDVKSEPSVSIDKIKKMDYRKDDSVVWKISCSFCSLPRSSLRTKLIVSTTDNQKPVTEVPIVIHKYKTFRALPSSVTLMTGGEKNNTSRTVRIISVDNKEFTIDNIESPGFVLAERIVSSRKRETQEFLQISPKGRLSTGIQSGVITVTLREINRAISTVLIPVFVIQKE